MVQSRVKTIGPEGAVKDKKPLVLSIHSFVVLIWTKTCQNGPVNLFKRPARVKSGQIGSVWVKSQHGPYHVDSIQHRMGGRYGTEQMDPSEDIKARGHTIRFLVSKIGRRHSDSPISRLK